MRWQSFFLALEEGPLWIEKSRVAAYDAHLSAAKKPSKTLSHTTTFAVTPPPATPATPAATVHHKTSSRVSAGTPIVPVPLMLPALSALAAVVAQCQACTLAKGRRKTVFGAGVENPTVLVVGEGPGFHEDLSGEPFVGRAGQLLNNALITVGFSRHKNTYISNVVKCRAVENNKDRRPRPEEIALCRGFLEQQITLLKPRIVLALGATAATTLLKRAPESTVQSLRGVVHHYCDAAGQNIPVVVSYHPAYLLRSPEDKALFWEDLCSLQSALETEQNSTQPSEKREKSVHKGDGS